jgi:hypothetical protein
MNQRIKQLAEQATTYIDPTANDGVCWDFDKEKFAELIVRECAEIADTAEPFLASDLIKEHFGVE